MAKAKVMFKLFTQQRELLFVTKNGNFQTLLLKEWWPLVHHMTVHHFDSLDDLEESIALAKNSGSKWNFR